jgi:peptidoglycan hydrolase-like protein with peptidoglycan-binding domain
MQQYLNDISDIYTSIPKVTEDGVYGNNTKYAVQVFQRQFGLSADGIIGQDTWNKIVQVYNSLDTPSEDYPGYLLKVGSRGSDVLLMQEYLNDISNIYTQIPKVTEDGIFGNGTKYAVQVFQRQFGLSPDGIIGKNTWDKIVEVHHSLNGDVEPYPGYVLKIGTRGSDVKLIQERLNIIANYYPSIPKVTVDGIFGTATHNQVLAYQKLFGLSQDGMVGPATWNSIMITYHNLTDNYYTQDFNTQDFNTQDLNLNLNQDSQNITQEHKLNTEQEFNINNLNSQTQTLNQNTGADLNLMTQNQNYPGYILKVGSRGNQVTLIQNYLNALANYYTQIPKASSDSIFGWRTYNQVIAFQKLFGLSQDGKIGPNTWHAIINAYNNLDSSGYDPEPIPDPEETYPGHPLTIGSRGESVKTIQDDLNEISQEYNSIPRQKSDGIFGSRTKNQVIAYQKLFDLIPDGIVGYPTWTSIIHTCNNINHDQDNNNNNHKPSYPGYVLKTGSRDSHVKLIQEYLNSISDYYPSIKKANPDGIFGWRTYNQVIAYQKLFGLSQDGMVGPNTWASIINTYYNLKSLTPNYNYPNTYQTQTQNSNSNSNQANSNQDYNLILKLNSQDPLVKSIQEALNSISNYYPSIPKTNPDFIFNTQTQNQVLAYQKLFGLNPDGIIGYNTYNSILNTYNSLSSLDQSNNSNSNTQSNSQATQSNSQTQSSLETYPNQTPTLNSQSSHIKLIQEYLNSISNYYPSIPKTTPDSIFNTQTQNQIISFQKLFGINPDGQLNSNTYQAIIDTYHNLY